MKHYLNPTGCPCGKTHTATVKEVVIEKGAIRQLPRFLQQFGSKKPFLLADRNTFAAAGEAVCSVLDNYAIYVFPQESLEPDEQAVGSAFLHFDPQCDLIIGIGSGVINDIGKILSNISEKPYIIVATAPSMDGYASATSSMSRDGLKVSVNSRCADVIIGDTDILKNAPAHMLRAGLGDMLAKFVSIAEWRIAHIVTGEYYCEEVAQLIRTAVKKCAENARGLMAREEHAVEAVMEGLVIGGIAMAYAGVSRPASGVEHYFSHVWDMRALQFGTPAQLHGIQCAAATLTAVKLYEQVKTVRPDYETAAGYVEAFDYDNWSGQLKRFLGASADTMIALEKQEGKYRKDTHKARFDRIAENWSRILAILEEELPSAESLRQLMRSVGLPSSLSDLGIDSADAKLTFLATKDIRDKYVLSRLAWDLGILDSLCIRL